MTTTSENILLDVSMLDNLATLLQARAIPFTRLDEALRCELNVAGQPYAVVLIVPAEGVFQENMDDRAFNRHFRDLQERVLGDAFYARPRKDLYLVVAGAEDFLAQSFVQRLTSDISHDVSYGKKEVLATEQVLDWLNNPFAQLSGALRANTSPALALVAEPRGSAQPTADYVLDVEKTLADSEEPRHLARHVAGAVYRRVMGGDHLVFWENNHPSLGRVGDTDGLPVSFCSSGERIVFAYALFLARAMLDVSPGMNLGIYGSFDRLDSVRQIGAYDCLRNFVMATGANVLVQSAKKSLRDLVAHRMRPVIEAYGGAVTDYPAA